MEFEQIDLLATRINKAVELIEQLKTENNTLQQKCDLLQSEFDDKNSLIQQLKEENQNLRLVQNESSLGKEREEKIRNKVELMLTKLDELQNL